MNTTAMRTYEGWYPGQILNMEKASYSQWEAAWDRTETPPQRLHLYAQQGHGHVYAQPRQMRCGGPGICLACHEEHLLMKHALKVGYYLGGKGLAPEYAKGPVKYPDLFAASGFNPVNHFKRFNSDFPNPSNIGPKSNEPMPEPRLEKLVKNLALMAVPPCTEDEFDAWVNDQAAIIRSIVRSESPTSKPSPKIELQLTANTAAVGKAMLSAATQMQAAVDAFVKSMSQVTIPVDLQATERKDHD